MNLSNYNSWTEKTIKLLPGEEICPVCKGKGVKKYFGPNDDWMFPCKKCKGEGKVDWIQRIILR